MSGPPRSKKIKSLTVYVSIGNSDNKLTRAEWAEFYRLTAELLAPATGFTTAIHGAWHSLPAQPWENACWCVEIQRPSAIEAVQVGLQALADKYRQDWIAWAVAATTVIHAKRQGISSDAAIRAGRNR